MAIDVESALKEGAKLSTLAAYVLVFGALAAVVTFGALGLPEIATVEEMTSSIAFEGNLMPILIWAVPTLLATAVFLGVGAWIAHKRK